MCLISALCHSGCLYFSPIYSMVKERDRAIKKYGFYEIAILDDSGQRIGTRKYTKDGSTVTYTKDAKDNPKK